MEELVVLVDEQNNQIGTAPKQRVHTAVTPLHRGFSVFLFNSKGELLLTRRAKTKKTFPGVWTNTVCGHPGPGESVVSAAKRRLVDELGIQESDLRDIQEVAPYRYTFADSNGIVENEICPVLLAHADVDPQPVHDEVEEWEWIDWNTYLVDITANAQKYSPWSIEEAKFIIPLV